MEFLELPFRKFLELVGKIKIDKFNDKFIESDCLTKECFRGLQVCPSTKLCSNKTGNHFDVSKMVELYGKYHSLETRTYMFFYYKQDEKLQFFRITTLIKSKKGQWFDTTKTSYLNNIKGFSDLGVLYRGIYKRFSLELKKIVKNFNQVNVGCNQINEVISVKSVREFLDYYVLREYTNTRKKEISSMAIVFCKNRALMLKTNHNEWVFPKGHIEQGETSLFAAKRECHEESGVILKDAKYYGSVPGFDYIFNGSFFRITDKEFFDIYGATSVIKQIDVHVFRVDEFQKIIWQVDENFKNGAWIDIGKIRKLLFYQNTVNVYNSALKLIKKGDNKNE